MQDAKARTLAKAAGDGARSIRIEAGATLAEVAKAIRAYGFPWSTGKVGDFEAGRIPPNLATLIAVAAALGDVRSDEITVGNVALADLFLGEDRIAITDELTMTAEEVRGILTGDSVLAGVGDMPAELGAVVRLVERVRAQEAGRPEWAQEMASDSVIEILGDFADADYKVTKSLGVEDQYVSAAAMMKLWQKTFVAERDRIAGADASAQKRGRISRNLKEQLRAAINGDDK